MFTLSQKIEHYTGFDHPDVVAVGCTTVGVVTTPSSSTPAPPPVRVRPQAIRYVTQDPSIVNMWL
jgi:hypothetical protein